MKNHPLARGNTSTVLGRFRASAWRWPWLARCSVASRPSAALRPLHGACGGLDPTSAPSWRSSWRRRTVRRRGS